MLLWVILALVFLLAFRLREGATVTVPGTGPKKPDTSKDLEPFPANSADCDVYEKTLKDNAHNQDVYYCRGFNGHTCGSIDPDKPSTPCPAGYEHTSWLKTQRLAESDPGVKK
jgi:hypothetical protein